MADGPGPPPSSAAPGRSAGVPTPPVREGVARSASVVAAATLGSRLLGLAREAVFAALFGTRWFADAFVFAFRIPNLLRDFFAEGALASAFVPTFTEVATHDGPERAFALARRTMGTLLAVTGLLALLGIVFAPAVVAVVAWDVPAEVRPLVVRLTRIMFPFLPLVALAAVAMGILNARSRYFVPALAPMFFNVVAVLGGLGLLAAGLPMEEAVTAWAVLVLVGGAVQFAVQVPLLRSLGWRGRPELDLRLRDPALRQIVRRMGPIVRSVAATNLMVLLTTALASQQRGWASSLNFAFRLVHLPIGLIGVALGTVVLSAGARHAAAADPEGLEDLGRRALRLNGFLALPAAVGLAVLAEPLVRLLYERGAFTVASTQEVAEALRAYAFGVVGYAGVKASAPVFLARGDTRTPVRCSLLGLAVNAGTALALVGPLGHRGLAWAVALGATTNYLALRLSALRQHGRGSFPGVPFLLRVGAASALLAAAGTWIVAPWLLGDAAPHGGLRGALVTLGAVGLLAGLYLGACVLLGLEEVGHLGRWWRRRRTP